MAELAAHLRAPLVSGALSHPIEATGTPPLLNDDPLLEKINSMVLKGSYPEAAAEASALLSQKQYDLRIVGTYLFGDFLARGMAATPELNESLLKTLTINWAAFGPQEKKVVLAEGSLRWLFKTMLRNFEFHERAQDQVWKSWNDLAVLPSLREAIALGPDVDAALKATLPATQGGAVDLYRRVSNWIQSHAQVLEAHEAANKAELAAANPETGTDTDTDTDAETGEDNQDVRKTSSPASVAHSSSVAVSPALAHLLKKLAAFQSLIAREDFMKAGVVASDVLTTIEHFDPRVYFPMLFSDFFSGLSQHVEHVEPWLQSSDTMAFKTLEQLYKVDLDAFLRLAIKKTEDD